MRIVRDRGDARWLPSRFDFALFRLFAYLRLRSARPEPRGGLMLPVDRHQSAFENYAVCILLLAVVTFYFAALVNPFAALPAAVIALQLSILISRAIMRIFRSADSDTIRGDSRIIMSAILAASVYFTTHDSPVRYVAGGFLALAALNAIASAIMFPLRGRVAELEAKFA